MVLTIIVVTVFLAIGAALLYSTIKARLKVDAARQWPVTKAAVLTSEILEDYTRTATGTVNPTYTPAVNYEYQVAGQKFTNARVVFGKIKFPFLEASDVLTHFPVGAEVDVYYNPEDPADSVLLPKSKQGLRSLVPGIFFIVSAVLILVVQLIYR